MKENNCDFLSLGQSNNFTIIIILLSSSKYVHSYGNYKFFNIQILLDYSNKHTQ